MWKPCLPHKPGKHSNNKTHPLEITGGCILKNKANQVYLKNSFFITLVGDMWIITLYFAYTRLRSGQSQWPQVRDHLHRGTLPHIPSRSLNSSSSLSKAS